MSELSTYTALLLQLLPEPMSTGVRELSVKIDGRNRCIASMTESGAMSACASSGPEITYLLCDDLLATTGSGGLGPLRARTITSPRSGSPARPKSYVTCTTCGTASPSLSAGTKRVRCSASRTTSTKSASVVLRTRKVLMSGWPFLPTTNMVLTSARAPLAMRDAG